MRWIMMPLGGAALAITSIIACAFLLFSSTFGYANSNPTLYQTAGEQGYLGDNAITLRARMMAAHLNSSCLGLNPECAGAAAYDAGFPQEAIAFGNQVCPGCSSWSNGSYQCVSFVRAAYGASFPAPADWTHPLELSRNANAGDWWANYQTEYAHYLGYQTIVAHSGGLPRSPGDIMVWTGGKYGHVSIVLAWHPPDKEKLGSITFAQANGQTPIQTLPITKDYRVDTHNGYWNGFVVEGYIHPTWLPSLQYGGQETEPPRPKGMPDSPYVQYAWDAARTVGIRPDTFLRQINQESGFNPNALSSAGAQGIAQFMPETAAALGIDPWNVYQSLTGAAHYMATLINQYQGDQAKALAAYNAGPGTVTLALRDGGNNWREYLPKETQEYIRHILDP